MKSFHFTETPFFVCQKVFDVIWSAILAMTIWTEPQISFFVHIIAIYVFPEFFNKLLCRTIAIPNGGAEILACRTEYSNVHNMLPILD